MKTDRDGARQSLTQLAGTLPHDPLFREFVAQFTPQIEFVCPDVAAEFIRLVCEIESRAELATSETAVWRFHEYLRRPFVDWRRERQRRQ